MMTPEDTREKARKHVEKMLNDTAAALGLTETGKTLVESALIIAYADGALEALNGGEF